MGVLLFFYCTFTCYKTPWITSTTPILLPSTRFYPSMISSSFSSRTAYAFHPHLMYTALISSSSREQNCSILGRCSIRCLASKHKCSVSKHKCSIPYFSPPYTPLFKKKKIKIGYPCIRYNFSVFSKKLIKKERRISWITTSSNARNSSLYPFFKPPYFS